MPSSEMLRRMVLVGTGVSEKRSASIISASKIGELGTMLEVTSNRSMLRRNTICVSPLLVTALFLAHRFFLP
jgi:hypothetical protein